MKKHPTSNSDKETKKVKWVGETQNLWPSMMKPLLRLPLPPFQPIVGFGFPLFRQRAHFLGGAQKSPPPPISSWQHRRRSGSKRGGREKRRGWLGKKKRLSFSLLACLSIHWSCHQVSSPKKKKDFSLGVWRDNLLINRLIKKKKVHITIFFRIFYAGKGFPGKNWGTTEPKSSEKSIIKFSSVGWWQKGGGRGEGKGKCLHSSKGFRLLNQRRWRYGGRMVGSSVSSKTFFVMTEKVERRGNIFLYRGFFR